MKKSIFFTLTLFAAAVGLCQSGEINKFYGYFKIPETQRKPYDSIYNLIQQRRAIFSKDYRSYKEKNNSIEDYSFDWCAFERQILPSLTLNVIKPLKQLIYYSYFDLGYGTMGLALDSIIAVNALKEIEPQSIIWAMEPSLVEAVIRSAGGEEKNSAFIRNLAEKNKDVSLQLFLKNNLSPERALKKNKNFPLFIFRDFSDTTKFLSTLNLRGKYYLLDIWATWCKPCIDEFPLLLKAYTEYKQKNIVEFVSISIDDDAKTALGFLRDRFSFPWMSGIANRTEVLKALMISGIPCPVLINANGKIISYGNELRGVNLTKTLQQLVTK